MKQIYLKVTYRNDGSPFAAYFYLPRKGGEKRAKCRRVEPGMILDINAEGSPIGLELTAPNLVTLDGVNGILQEYGLEPVSESTLEPLLAA
jgi:hypothetical protein